MEIGGLLLNLMMLMSYWWTIRITIKEKVKEYKR
jgi:hypothetical protein